MITPNWSPGDRQLRQFGWACLPGFAVVGFFVAYRIFGSVNAAYALIGFGVLCLLASLVRPGLLLPIYTVLMAITMPIGWCLSHILLRLFFYGVLTPIGFVFRMIGRDPLMIRKPDGSSYWREHTQRTDPLTYYRQS